MTNTFRRFGFILLALYLIIYAFFLIITVLNDSSVLAPGFFPSTKSFIIQYKMTRYLQIVGGIVLLLSGLTMIIFKYWGRFIGIIALIMAIILHVSQILILRDYGNVLALSEAYWSGIQMLIQQGLLVDWDVLNVLGQLEGSSHGIGLYWVEAIGFIIVNFLGIIYLSWFEAGKETISGKSPILEYMAKISNDNVNASSEKGERRLRWLTIAMMAGGLTTLILGLSYWILFPAPNFLISAPYLFWVQVISLIILTSLLFFALTLNERKVEGIPYAVFFFSLLFIYVLIRGWQWPKLFSAGYTHHSLVQKEAWWHLAFIYADLLTLVIYLLIIALGIHSFLANRNVITLFLQEEKKSKITIY